MTNHDHDLIPTHMTASEAVAAIRDGARELVAAEYAEQIARAFGVALRDLGYVTRPGPPPRDFRRASVSDGGSVAICNLAVDLAARLVGDFEDPGFPYLWEEANARHRSLAAAAALASIADGESL
jgi:hypothetical protein